MTTRPLLVIILAAGKGTRMRSARPKVLHEIAGRSMLGHVVASATELGASAIAVVIGPDMDDVRREALRWAPAASIFVQEAQAGTGDAVRAAGPAIAAHDGDVLVLYADTPLITVATLGRMRERLAQGADIVVLGFRAADPTGYGRLITQESGILVAIREHNDASPAERAIEFCNSGVLAFRGQNLSGLLASLDNRNAKGEFYLTDTVAIGRARNLTAVALACEESEVLGINNRVQLAEAEALCQHRLRERAMLGGVTMRDPASVYLAFDTRFGQDVTIEPNVVFGPGVEVGERVTVRAHSHLEGVRIGDGAQVGPFARLRPGTVLAAGARIGNFVEVKAAEIGEGAKVNHLSYIGDASVGAKANVGAGTITCNYDGYFKHRTEIGSGAFIGSNSALVAPVRIGVDAYIGSGSVVTRDVADGDLALTRATQDVRPGWATRFRERMARIKAERDARRDGRKGGGGDEHH
ncbi:MAG: bifunctional UDP-N-acetylglucosamine diphosphorylase/glucosamine-1-phosphate N-acetyltransferase GlmU [Rhizobiales bacterium]|nr:bifunctional UDP-N-acetylglucosamine diphosphorylase/glucosamine-1-phosphate N-acetyltransferase GlmU [Hyphomicrobiales bacterium]